MRKPNQTESQHLAAVLGTAHTGRDTHLCHTLSSLWQPLVIRHRKTFSFHPSYTHVFYIYRRSIRSFCHTFSGGGFAPPVLISLIQQSRWKPEYQFQLSCLNSNAWSTPSLLPLTDCKQTLRLKRKKKKGDSYFSPILLNKICCLQRGFFFFNT